MKSVREEAARWFTRLRDAGPEHPDRGRFETWLASSPMHAAEYAAIEDVWNDFNSTSRLEKLAGAVERGSLAEKERTESRRQALKRGVLGLFFFAGAGAAAWQGWQYWQGLPLMQLAAQTRSGEIGKQALPDGSSVVLGGGSRIEVAFYRDRRVVTLVNGDAIFEVARDERRPFVVDSGIARATVLGTRFAVNRGQQIVRVSVEHGLVRVENLMGGEPALLEAGQVAEVESGGSLRRVSATASDGFAWQRGTLLFDNASLREIAATLSRYRQLPVRAPETSAQRITAVVQTADIEYFLRSLPSIASVRIEDHPRETRIVPQ